MFHNLRKLRRLKNEIRQIREQYEENLRKIETDDELTALANEAATKSEPLVCERETLIDRKVLASAAKFGVHVPTPEESPKAWKKKGRYMTNTYLTSQGRAQITRAISEARFAYWERWSKLLVPILTFLVGLMGLLVAALSLLLKK
jgi:hypothetical protein